MTKAIGRSTKGGSTTTKVVPPAIAPHSKPNVLIDPTLRWKCQISLCRCLDIVEYAPMIPLENEKDTHIVVYCRQLENITYGQSMRDKDRYRYKIQQLIFALRRMGLQLIEKYTPQQLVALDTSILRQEMAKTKESKEYELKVLACKQLMKSTDIFNGLEGESNQSMMRCYLCKSSVAFQPLQTRSADEGMTIYCRCTNEKCNNRWKFSG